MGERKGQNHYYPPDWRPELGNLNKFHGTHALAERASKIHLGILTIRFEMPFNIWCNGCGNHVGMGVRYNAEKRKIGMYYTTPLWEFRMKCHLCDNYYEFRTDPKNFDYEVFSGARRQERRWDPESTEQVEATDKATSQKLLTDPMFKLEHGKDDQIKAASVRPVIDQLTDYQSRMKDDYDQNSLVRNLFRTEKKKIKLADDADNKLLKKNSLSIKLVPEVEEDRRVAALLKYSIIESSEQRQKRKREEIDSRPVLPSSANRPLLSSLSRSFSFGTVESPEPLEIPQKRQKRSEEPLKNSFLGKLSSFPSGLGKPSSDTAPVKLQSPLEFGFIPKNSIGKDMENNLSSEMDSKPLIESEEEDVSPVAQRRSLVTDGYGSSDSD